MDSEWKLSLSDLYKILESGPEGLSSEEAKKRLEKYGKNELSEEKVETPLKIFLDQFKSFLILILIIAAIISFGIGYYTNSTEEIIDGTAIIAIVIINAILGFVQEYRAEKAVEALKKMATPKALVMRDGQRMLISTSEVVPGDILILEDGQKVAADARLIESHDLRVDESTLTGESTPVRKEVTTINKDVPLAERRNMVFMNTHITFGHGKAIVVSTGMKTEVGKIAGKILATPEGRTPMQEKLEKLSKKLGLVILGICVLIFGIEIYFKEPLIEAFLLSVSLAVSAIPEGLPAVVTLALAIGLQIMAKRNALVRKLSAIETLGMVTTICTDKTGTLTKNEMTVKEIFIDNKNFEVTGEGYEPIGELKLNGEKIETKRIAGIDKLLEISVLCNNASLNKKNGEYFIIGDPTEGALIVLGEKFEYSRNVLKKEFKFIHEIPFSSERKRMSVIYEKDGKKIAYVKGAPEIILERCSKQLAKNKITNIDKKKLKEVSDKMANKALRVLAVAYKVLPKKFSIEDVEKDLIFVGFVGMIDPPRPEVKAAIKVAHEAGIKTIMATGDHKKTAIAIAKQIGIMKKGDMVLTGNELNKMSDDYLERVIKKVTVFARISPQDKVRILSALKKNGEIVAMTGDGVNDAPALKEAHVGVAMGIKGTDVAKEASDMILEDDNYATIVNAVETGRGIYDNIKKFIRFLLSANFDEILVVGSSYFMDLPLPLLPLQILWINLITDSGPALALSVDPFEKGIMKKQPRDPKEGILSGMTYFIIIAGIVAAIATLSSFLYGLSFSVEKARTMAFTTAVMFELFFVFNCRSEDKWVFHKNPFSNKKLILAVVIGFVLQLSVIYLTPLQIVFKTTALSLMDWIVLLPLSTLGLFIPPNLFKKTND